MKTPQSRFLQELRNAEVLSTNEPVDYFESGNGAMWMLCIAQGIERLQQHCLAIEGVLPVYSDARKKA